MGFITRKGVKSFRVKGIVKGVKNLYIASQWIMAPGGLPVAVTAGKFAVWRIARKDKRNMFIKELSDKLGCKGTKLYNKLR